MSTYSIRAEVTLVLEKVQDYENYDHALKDKKFLESCDLDYLLGLLKRKVIHIQFNAPEKAGAK